MPDRLGEDYVAGTLAGDPAAVTLVEDLRAGANPTGVGAALTVLVEAAHRHATVAATVVVPTIAARPGVALTVSGSALARLVTLDALDEQIASRVRDLLRDEIGPVGLHTGTPSEWRPLSSGSPTGQQQPLPPRRSGLPSWPT